MDVGFELQGRLAFRAQAAPFRIGGLRQQHNCPQVPNDLEPLTGFDGTGAYSFDEGLGVYCSINYVGTTGGMLVANMQSF